MYTKSRFSIHDKLVMYKKCRFLYMIRSSYMRFYDFLYMIYALPLKNSLALRILVNKLIIRMLGKSW